MVIGPDLATEHTISLREVQWTDSVGQLLVRQLLSMTHDLTPGDLRAVHGIMYELRLTFSLEQLSRRLLIFPPVLDL